MIITRTPFRISFAGGGTDLAAYYEREPGAVLSTAIDKYMYITVNERFGNTFRISYSRTELAESPGEIEHPIVRASFEMLDVKTGIELVSIADLPAQGGMGSSSSFTVGILHALHALQGHVVTAKRLAEQACDIEIERLGEPIGKQDQYIAAYGGLQLIQFMPNGQVYVDPVICRPETLQELNRRLMLFFIGGARNARDVLGKQRMNTDEKMPALRRLRDLAFELKDILTLGRDLNAFGHGLHQAWEAKKCLEKSIHNSAIDEYYAKALEAGALGGKLLGAGGGGFLLFFCEPHLQDKVRRALQPLPETRFRMEPQGSKVIYVGSDRW
jgi:D-glycero-alpha-D-manno-heptose-7-phosphate kinase